MPRVDLEEVLEAIEEFDDFEPCECFECRHNARSHGVDVSASMANLIDELGRLFDE